MPSHDSPTDVKPQKGSGSKVVLHSPALRRFTKHLIKASFRRSVREQKIKQLSKDVDVDMIMGDYRSKEQVMDSIDHLREKMMTLAAEEKGFLVQQEHDLNMIDTMQQRVQSIEEKLDALSHIAYIHSKHARDENNNLKRKNNPANFSNPS